jgi:superfamily II DNA or RNA helicase
MPDPVMTEPTIADPSATDKASDQAPDLALDLALDDSLAAPINPPPSLRPYQEQVITDVYAKVREGYRRIVLVAGTGAGKTVISGQICAHAEAAGSRLLFLVHLDVLVGQTYDKMKSFGLHCGFIKAGWPEDPTAPIQIASVQTMAKRNWWRDWSADLVFYDEGHTTVFSQVGQQLIYETHKDAVHLAMTATPYRLGSTQLGDHFETMVTAPPPATLQKMGFLAQMKYYGIPGEDQLDLGGIQVVAGDYDEKQLKNACDRPELIDRVVTEWQRLTPGKRTIAFCVDVEHARHVSQAFAAAGIASDYVSGATGSKKRALLYESIARGDLRVLTSCNVLSIGFDVPSIEVGLLLRPTMSLALHHQQVGRVMRISPKTGKSHGIILDQAGNLQRLGFPEDVQEYEMPYGTGEDKPGKSKRGAPKKACPQCGTYINTFAMDCPDCGYDWRTARESYSSELIELMTRDQLSAVQDEGTRYQIFCSIRQRIYRKGYGPGFAQQEYYDCFQCRPDPSWYLGAIFGKQPIEDDRKDYEYYLRVVANKLGKGQAWMIEEFNKEFGPGD